MNPSLPSLPLTSGKPGLLPGSAKESHLNQSSAGSSGGFEGLLGEAHTALSSSAKEQPVAPEGAEQLHGEQQTLPQDGKLLPLLQRTLHHLAENGVDPQQFVERLNAKLEALTQNSELQPAEQLAAALHQLIQEQPALKSVLPRETLALVATGGAIGTVSNGFAEQARKVADAGIDPERVPQPASVKPIKSVQLDQPVQQALANELKPATSDNTLSQLQQQLAAPEQRQPELAVLMAALKRMTAGNRAASAEGTFRPDLAATSAASPVLAATTANAAVSGTPTVSVTTPFGQAGWDQALGERIQWLAGQKVQGAHVKLNPANLGPMEVRIQVQNDQASVQFTAHHAVVREALEAALPRLRDMFEASGVELVDVDVSSDESFAEQRAMQDPSKPRGVSGHDDQEPALETHLETSLTAFAAEGHLDLFA